MDNNTLVIILKKYCYIVIPLITVILFIMLNSFKLFNVKNFQENLSTIVGISGTLIGFLFTAMTIFFSLNKDSRYMKNFKKYNHHIIFCRLITFGIIFLCLNITSWIFNINANLTILLFILGFEETIMSAYYTYKLSLNSFQ